MTPRYNFISSCSSDSCAREQAHGFSSFYLYQVTLFLFYNAIVYRLRVFSVSLLQFFSRGGNHPTVRRPGKRYDSIKSSRKHFYVPLGVLDLKLNYIVGLEVHIH